MTPEQGTAAKTPLDAALKQLGISGSWLAREVGTDVAVISRYRNGLKPPVKTQTSIVAALNRRAGELRDLDFVSESDLWPDQERAA